MAADIPTAVPTQLTVGNTATWKVRLSDYPAAEGWTLRYAFMRNDTGQKIEIESTASGDDHLVSVSAEDASGWIAGIYQGQGFVSKATERYPVWVGNVEVLPDFAALTDSDPRTIARKTLDALNVAILKVSQTQSTARAGSITEWTAEGLSIKRENSSDLLEELLKQRDRFAAIVRNEEDQAKLAMGRATGRRFLTRFSRP